MGFDARLYWYPKYKDFTITEYNAIEAYFEYQNSSFYQQQYTLSEYYKNNGITYLPTLADIDFFAQYVSIDDYGYAHVYTSIADWGGNGVDLYDLICHESNSTSDQETFSLNQESVANIIIALYQKIQRVFPVKPVWIESAYNTYPTEDGMVTKLMKCEGVELTYEEGYTQRIHTANSEEPIGIIDDYDQYDYANLIHDFETMLQLLRFDFQNKVLFFGGGW